jgi:hypothetical protein
MKEKIYILVELTKDDRKVFILQYVVEENFEAVMPCTGARWPNSGPLDPKMAQ